MNVLVVDDDTASRTGMASFLTQLGHQVTEAADGRQALAVLEQEPIQMVLSDIRMPAMDGQTLLKTIRDDARWTDVIVVLVTGYGDVRGAVSAIQAGAYEYLLKPVKAEELGALAERIAELLHLRTVNRQLTEHFDDAVRSATSELSEELDRLRVSFARVMGVPDIGVHSDAFSALLKKAYLLHNQPQVSVMIEGETGVGKEMIARFIHFGEAETTTPFVAVNCAAVTQTLFESELFGYEPGAFTGGNPKGQKGKIELAAGGTILLDEVSEMGIEYQAKLLRVLQEREYYKVGGLQKMSTDVRFICTTNRDIRDMVQKGEFREDLYYRLNVGHIVIPPLRDRIEEIIPLASIFLERFAKGQPSGSTQITEEAAQALRAHSWPGNVRELRALIERVYLFNNKPVITLDQLDYLASDTLATSQSSASSGVLSEDLELPEGGLDLNALGVSVVKKTLKKFKGNKAKAARFLNINRRTIYTYLARIEEEDKNQSSE